ncbi:MAG: hypothetical protein IPH91_03655 [Elusimicrobia bacterium]|nr:hypothetical protein [Elusimicrobiota bacterium]MBK8651449.1 hypothetical protein [Elusimicrobiota bacterium]
MPNRPIPASADRGQAPTIADFDKANPPLGLEFNKLSEAPQTFIGKRFVDIETH